MNNNLLIKLFSLIGLFIFWAILSNVLSIETLPPPGEVFLTLKEELLEGNLLYHLTITLYKYSFLYCGCLLE